MFKSITKLYFVYSRLAAVDERTSIRCELTWPKMPDFRVAHDLLNSVQVPITTTYFHEWDLLIKSILLSFQTTNNRILFLIIRRIHGITRYKSNNWSQRFTKKKDSKEDVSQPHWFELSQKWTKKDCIISGASMPLAIPFFVAKRGGHE